jgi:hypothetical protein
VTHQFCGCLAEIFAVGLINKGELSIGQKPTDQFGLILNNRAIALLAFANDLLRLPAIFQLLLLGFVSLNPTYALTPRLFRSHSLPVPYCTVLDVALMHRRL